MRRCLTLIALWLAVGVSHAHAIASDLAHAIASDLVQPAVMAAAPSGARPSATVIANLGSSLADDAGLRIAVLRDPQVVVRRLPLFPEPVTTDAAPIVEESLAAPGSSGTSGSVLLALAAIMIWIVGKRSL